MLTEIEKKELLIDEYEETRCCGDCWCGKMCPCGGWVWCIKEEDFFDVDSSLDCWEPR